MPKVTVSQEVKGSPAKVFGKIRSYCDKKLILREVGNLKPKVEWKEKKRMGTFKEKGVKGTIRMTSKSPCKVTITMEIPFYLSPIKGILAESIQKHLAKFT